MQKPQNSTLINICILPDEAVTKECIKLSQSLESAQTMFVLGNGLFPHMTVYMARFPDDEINNVVANTASALNKASPFSCVHTGYFMTAGRYLEASFRKTDSFLAFQELLIAGSTDLRINPGSPFEEGYFAPYTDEQQKNAKETGYDLARNLYRPHITLTRYHENEVPAVVPITSEIDLSFELHRICVCKADDNGAVYEILREFRI
jgi:hypothetical protein